MRLADLNISWGFKMPVDSWEYMLVNKFTQKKRNLSTYLSTSIYMAERQLNSNHENINNLFPNRGIEL